MSLSQNRFPTGLKILDNEMAVSVAEVDEADYMRGVLCFHYFNIHKNVIIDF